MIDYILMAAGIIMMVWCFENSMECAKERKLVGLRFVAVTIYATIMSTITWPVMTAIESINSINEIFEKDS